MESLSRRVRRLFEIKVREVSLVDRAANKRKFLVIKRKEGGSTGMEIEKVLSNIEDALEVICKKIEDLEKGKEEKDIMEVFFELDAEKAGAKFSKDTLNKLKSMRDSLSSLITSVEGEVSDGKDTKKEYVEDEDEFSSILSKGFKEGFSPEKKDKKEDEKIAKVISETIKQALAVVNAEK